MILLLTIMLASSATLSEVDQLFGYGAKHAQEIRGLEILEQALALSPADYDLLWRTARSYYYAGEGAPPQERLIYFERGIAVGKRAVAQNPQGVEGHFWLAASYGGFCREKGGITAFRNVKNVRTGMEMVLRLNDSYEEGSAYTALGEIDRQLPQLFGGNRKRGIATLEQGLKISPDNPEIKFALAESYLEAKRTDDALVQLRQLVRLQLTSPRAYLGRLTQEKAQKLLSQLDTK
jgi:tetratricopeptide (TPR) repeat protein